MITFLLNDTECKPAVCDPHQSVLDFLREQLQQKGTKEGCASGDCGACTVVLGEAVDGSIHYKSINACITPVATLHGKQLITVEHLKQDGELHPVQRAMVDCHGSQCGFCTPGFVMSMFAYRKNHATPERESINEALGGNLCRCTGYRPIIDATVKMYDAALEDQFSQSEAQTVAALEAINAASDSNAISLQQLSKRYFAPGTIDELAELLLEYPQARLIAGGTDLFLELTQFLRQFEILIYTGRVAEMIQTRDTASSIDIGAAVTFNDCAETLISYYPDLDELLARLGSLQIRNQGTLGGNIGNASPIGDMPPVLLALGAQLVLRRGQQTRTLALEDYFVSYKVTAQQSSEFIERIIVPKPDSGYVFRAYKISKRLEDDISATCGAFYVKLADGVVIDARIAFGGMAAIPARAKHCEQALIGSHWQQASIDSAMAALALDFQPISDFRASAEYRLSVSQNMLRRLYLELQSPADNIRVTHYA